MFVTRLLSGIVLLLLMFGSIFFGDMVLLEVMLVISVIGMYELYRVLKMQWSAPAMLGYLACCVYYCLLALGHEGWAVCLISVMFLLQMTCYVVQYPKLDLKQIMGSCFAFLYLALMLSCIYLIRERFDGGIYLVWMVFIGSWGSDTCAYCVGRLLGKHKAFPVLSPKKSVEGCIGGVLGAALLGFLYGTIFQSHIHTELPPGVLLAMVAAISSVFAQIGDLAASAIKREHEIKDYSLLIPGHGGILDRFDSVIFIAPAVYYLLQLLM